VAGFTADINGKPAGGIGVGLHVKVLLQSGGVAFSAHPIPGLATVGPVQPVPCPLHLIRRQPIPSPLLNIPSQIETLQSPPGKGYQILLQGIYAKDMGDLKNPGSAIWPLGLHEKTLLFPEKPAGHPIMRVGKEHLTEICENSLLCGHIHSQIMVRPLPFFIESFVAASTFLTPDKLQWSRLWGTYRVLGSEKVEKRGQQTDENRQ
jgi:hypothetical protein